MSALETYANNVIFAALNNKFTPLFVEWLEEKTQKDFDARLSILASVAIGRSIDRQSQFWSDYKWARDVRNKIVHSGKRVSSPDARRVIQTVFGWLTYLGSTIELELSLIGLKKHVEANRISINREEEVISIVRDYYGQTKAASTLTELPFEVITDKRLSAPRGDLILTFGAYRILVETKLIRTTELSNLLGPKIRHHRDGGMTFRQSILNDLIDQVSANIDFIEGIYSEGKIELNLTQGVFVVFVKGGGESPDEYTSVRKYHGGKVLVVLINI